MKLPWKRQKTWRQELAEDRRKQKLEIARQKKKKELEAKRQEKLKKNEELARKRKAPKIGKNGKTWAEHEAQKKIIDSKHLEKFQALYYDKPLRSKIDHELWSGYVKIRSRTAALGHSKRFVVIQGHFLYVFKRDKPKARLMRAVLLKRAEVQTFAMRDGQYYIVRVIPKTPFQPFINKALPSAKLLDGSIQMACVNRVVQDGLAKEIKRLSKLRCAGRSDDKGAAHQELDLTTASTGGQKGEKHVIKWKEMFKNPPTLAKLGLHDKAGWLDVGGWFLSPWKRRFIVLKGHWLYEFQDNMPSTKANRVVFIGGAKIVSNNFANNGFTIHSAFQKNPNKLGSMNKQYSLQCNTLEAMSEWQNIIQTHAAMKCAGRSKRKLPKIDVVETLPSVVSMFHYAI